MTETPGNVAAEPVTPRLQFSLAAIFCVVTSIAILCALARWERTFPYWTIPPAVMFLFSCFAACHWRSADLAWSLFAVGWLITLIDAVDTTIDSFAILGAPPKTSEMQLRFVYACVSRIALPLFLSIPSVYLARRCSTGVTSPATKWLIGCAAAAFLDVTLLTTLLVLFVSLGWPF